MKRFPLDKFPHTNLRPQLVANHEHHIASLERDIEGYSKVGHRDQSMYDWLLMVFENLGLSTVRDQYLDSLAVTKTRLALFVVLIDDTVDNADKRDLNLLEEIVKVPFNGKYIDSSKLDATAVKYLEFTKSLWSEIINEISTYPNYEKYREPFDFDIKQLLNSMEYSRLVNTCPNATNLLENDVYVHHSMIVLIQIDLDLMCSDGFDDLELGKLRELGYISQKMAKIGNLLGTYKREMVEADMSSEAFVKMRKGYGDLKLQAGKNIRFEEEMVREWNMQYQMAKELSSQIKSLDMDRFLKEREFIQIAYRKKPDSW